MKFKVSIDDTKIRKNELEKFLNEKFGGATVEYDNAELQYKLKKLEETVKRQEKTIAELNINYSTANKVLADISSSFFWRATYPLRKITQSVKNVLSKSRHITGACIFLKCLIFHGYGNAKRKYRIYMNSKPIRLKALHVITAERRRTETNHEFENPVKFSILVPLYNTPKEYLEQMIKSVKDQTYSNWELCLADGSDNEHAYVGEKCIQLASKDERIKYRKLEKNGGISENTNACIDISSGEYIVLFDHDDILHPSALFELMKAIDEKNADFIYTDEVTFVENDLENISVFHFKPDFAPDNLRGINYICHLTAFSRELMDKVGKFNPECDGSQDYDMVLRLTEQAQNIVHIAKPLYFWRAHKASVASEIAAKPYVLEAAKRAIGAHLDRVGLKGEVVDTRVPSIYKINYEIKGEPLISILIPNKDHIDDLDKCIESITQKSTYKNYEIIIIENNSNEQITFEYYESIKSDPKIRIIKWEGEFNYSAINNFGAKHANGEYLLLLNNDVEIITENWLEEMLMYAQRKDVGAVGVKLVYPDETVQHGGICLGILTLAGHYHKGFDRNHPGYMGRLSYAQDVTGVTAACLMMRKDVFDEVNGLDESFKVAFNDVDLCMRIRQKNYLIIFTPFAELYHYESKSRGLDNTKEKRTRFVSEVNRFQERWRAELDKGDPYYNINLSLDSEDFKIEIKNV